MLGNRASAHVGSNKLLIVIFTNVLPAVPMAGVGIFWSWSHDHLPRIVQLCSFLLALQWCEFKTYVLVSKKYYWISAAASSKTTQRGKKRFFLCFEKLQLVERLALTCFQFWSIIAVYSSIGWWFSKLAKTNMHPSFSSPHQSSPERDGLLPSSYLGIWRLSSPQNTHSTISYKPLWVKVIWAKNIQSR